MNICKLLQKQIYNILSHKYYVICFTFLLFTTLISLIHLCEVWLNGVLSTSEQLWLSYIVDNIGGVTLEKRLCQYLPVDVVYTWVNGSDPLMQLQLQQYRIKLKIDLSIGCSYPDCLPSHFTVYRVNTNHHTTLLSGAKRRLKSSNESYTLIFTNYSISSQKQTLRRQNIWKLYEWKSPNDAADILRLKITESFLNGNNSKIFNELHQPHWTTDNNIPNVYSPEGYLMLKFSKNITVTNSQLSGWLGHKIRSFWIYGNKNIIMVQLDEKESAGEILMKYSKEKWILFNKEDNVKIKLSQAHLVLELPFNVKESDYSLTRFDDKEELRYSLRSLEKYAPWVRKVYLVTNGQVPHWLNLENPRISIVPHDLIFQENTDLPTFSSPAIETHLHRIPGLSQKFLYLNDDLLIGEDIWPDDFISSSLGQKVYLSWPVPDCASECTWLWIGNGVCDKQCNISACDFDGGDCDDFSEPDNRNLNFFHEHHGEEDEWNNEENENVYDEQHRNEFRNKREVTSLNINDTGVIDVHIKRLLLNYLLQSDKVTYITSTFARLFKYLLNLKYYIYGDSFVKFDNKQQRNISQHKFNYKTVNKKRFGSILKDNIRKYASKDYKRVRRGILNVHQSIQKPKGSVDNFNDGSNVTGNFQTDHLTKVAEDYKLTSRNLSDFQGYPIQKYETLFREMSKNVGINTKTNSSGFEIKHLNNYEHHHDHEHHDDADDMAFSKRKLDTFAESLIYVQRIFNKVYGFKPRKVPAHMPHLIDKSIMESLQRRFRTEYVKTSSHRVRSSDDMQFAFSYFYYLMSEQDVIPVEEIFNTFDTDETGTWSDREIRTVMTRLYPLPLHQSNMMEFEKHLKDCSSGVNKRFVRNHIQEQKTHPPYERYLGSTLPLITKDLVVNCKEIIKILNSTFNYRKRYPFTVVKHDPYVGFHMISSNLSELLYTLDKIRQKPKKFLCLNDNMDPARTEDNELVRAVVLDFYHSLFPKPSQFELSSEYRNRFLYYDEYRTWRQQHSLLASLILFVIILIFVVIFVLLCNREMYALFRKVAFMIKPPSFNILRAKRRSYEQSYSYYL